MNTNPISPSTKEVKRKLIQAESINLLLISNFESGSLLTDNHIIAALMTIGDLIHDSRDRLNQGAANE